jgi:hypothetical protein
MCASAVLAIATLVSFSADGNSVGPRRSGWRPPGQVQPAEAASAASARGRHSLPASELEGPVLLPAAVSSPVLAATATSPSLPAAAGSAALTTAAAPPAVLPGSTAPALLPDSVAEPLSSSGTIRRCGHAGCPDGSCLHDGSAIVIGSDTVIDSGTCSDCDCEIVAPKKQCKCLRCRARRLLGLEHKRTAHRCGEPTCVRCNPGVERLMAEPLPEPKPDRPSFWSRLFPQRHEKPNYSQAKPEWPVQYDPAPAPPIVTQTKIPRRPPKAVARSSATTVEPPDFRTPIAWSERQATHVSRPRRPAAEPTTRLAAWEPPPAPRTTVPPPPAPFAIAPRRPPEPATPSRVVCCYPPVAACAPPPCPTPAYQCVQPAQCVPPVACQPIRCVQPVACQPVYYATPQVCMPAQYCAPF